jgi:hypothetical protein
MCCVDSSAPLFPTIWKRRPWGPLIRLVENLSLRALGYKHKATQLRNIDHVCYV